MESIYRNIEINLSAEKAYQYFLHNLDEWWPKMYTWAGEGLSELKVEVKEGGLLSEVGSYGFRCDWGRIIQLMEGENVMLLWQIGPNREPVPDPEKASTVKVDFAIVHNTTTQVSLEHSGFKKHGEGAGAYREAMNSAQGWAFILSCFKKYCESRS